MFNLPGIYFCEWCEVAGCPKNIYWTICSFLTYLKQLLSYILNSQIPIDHLLDSPYVLLIYSSFPELVSILIAPAL